MKNSLFARLLPLALLLGTALSHLHAAEADAPAVPQIDPAATAIWTQHIEAMGDRGEGPTPINNAEVSGKALEFFEKYPNERRVGGILYNLSNFGEWIQGDKAPELAAAWRAHLRDTLAATLRDKTWPDNVWSGLNWVAALNDIAIQTAAKPDAASDLSVLTTRIDTIAKRVPTSPYRVFLEQEYIRQLERHAPDKLLAHLRELSASDIPDLASLGNGQLAIQQLRTTPIEMQFTALDGREVDFAKLRGKVVLIDFWATWCVPCVKQLPNIKAAYEKYHDQGFEVVAITSDRPADKAKLEKFIADQKLPWPQYFNAAGGPNKYAKQYNIRSIPATFLIGRDGLLVTTETHDEKLEAALAKLFAK